MKPPSSYRRIFWWVSALGLSNCTNHLVYQYRTCFCPRKLLQISSENVLSIILRIHVVSPCDFLIILFVGQQYRNFSHLKILSTAFVKIWSSSQLFWSFAAITRFYLLFNFLTSLLTIASSFVEIVFLRPHFLRTSREESACFFTYGRTIIYNRISEKLVCCRLIEIQNILA